ncbi:zinc transporter 4 [Pseudorasbora parva]|uniref:zinc transporter 4 n=1 Tax=Pseudorasbora parva TaxID=51549 RepID=UPI00351DF3DB
MSGSGLVGRVRAALRRPTDTWHLSDAAAGFESADLEEDEPPRFSRLRVVVSGDELSNGSAVSTLVLEDDDDALLDSSGPAPDDCHRCRRTREAERRRRVMRKLASAAVLYFLFMIGELIGGYVANSLAIMTDALHMLTDLIGIVVSLLALWLSAKPPTYRFTFGLHRLEVLSAGISVLLIYILTGVLLNEAAQRTIHQDFTIDGDVMLITAAVGVAVNLLMGFLLNQSGHLHSHGHGHSHGSPERGQGQRGQGQQGQGQRGHGSLAVRAAFIHALGDLVQSVGVLIAAYIVRFKPEYKLADPICTYLFSVLVLFSTFQIIRDTGIILLEGVPRHMDVSGIRADLLKLQHVESVEELKLWALTADRTAAIVHLLLAPGIVGNWEDVQSSARRLLMANHGVSHCTVQLQTRRAGALMTCTHCLTSSA